MHTVKIIFQPVDKDDSKSIVDSVIFLLGAWRMNGQILGTQFPIAETRGGLEIYVNTPTDTSLSEEFNNEYVDNHISEITKHKVKAKITVLGKEPESARICNCPTVTKYILFTSYASLESPLKCFECFGIVPLYKIPKTANGEYHDIISWQSDYQACDSLQMNCAVGERFGTDQISKHDSPLTRKGLKVCQSIKKATGRQVFYYLYRYNAKSYKNELLRKCPNCSGDWYLKTPLHGKFDFMCKKCNLLSNIAWDVRG